MRLIVVEDSPLIRSLLVELVCSEPDKKVVAAIPSGAEVVETVGRLAPDALLYAFPPGVSQHAEAVLQIKQASPASRVLVLFNDPCQECSNRCLKAGVEVCLDKTAEFDRILDVLNHGPES